MLTSSLAAAKSARFRTPFTDLGVAPEYGSSWLLPQQVGHQMASWMLLSSSWVNAEEAREARTRVLRVVDDAELLETISDDGPRNHQTRCDCSPCGESERIADQSSWCSGPGSAGGAGRVRQADRQRVRLGPQFVVAVTAARFSWRTTACSVSAGPQRTRCIPPSRRAHREDYLGAHQLGNVTLLPDDIVANFTNIYGYIRREMWTS